MTSGNGREPGGPRKGQPTGYEQPSLPGDGNERITLPEMAGRLKNKEIIATKTLAELRTLVAASQGIQQEDGSVVSAAELLEVIDALDVEARRASQLKPDPTRVIELAGVPSSEGLSGRMRALFARECLIYMLKEVQSFEGLKEALRYVYFLEGGMQTHTRAKVASQVQAIEEAVRAGDFAEAEAELVAVTREAGLRETIKRLIQKQRIPKTRVVEIGSRPAETGSFKEAQSLDDVERIIRRLPGLMGSHFYRQTDLLAMLDVARTCLGHKPFLDPTAWQSTTKSELLKVTSAGGLRQALERIWGVA